jgi:tRNA(Glu) U13 pseudouridine synthase TruD
VVSVPNLDPLHALQLTLPHARARPRAIPSSHGHLRGNTFESRCAGDAAAAALAHGLAGSCAGMPNRYGEQRFGRDGDNAVRAAAYCSPVASVRDAATLAS